MANARRARLYCTPRRVNLLPPERYMEAMEKMSCWPLIWQRRGPVGSPLRDGHDHRQLPSSARCCGPRTGTGRWLA